MHAFRTIDDSLFTEPPAYAGHSEGFSRAELIGPEQGSVHIGFSIAALGAGSRVDTRVHSYEKGIFVLEGEIELNREGRNFRLGKHDYALIPTGTAHAFRNNSGTAARWVEKCAPQPKPHGGWEDSFFTPPLDWPEVTLKPDPKNPAYRNTGHFGEGQLPPPQKVDEYMWGWSKKMLMDRASGSQQFNLFIIEFEEGGQTNGHEHPFEEAYLVLEGEGTFTAEGKEYILKPGTIGWSGVGSPHGFFMNRGSACRWLEVMTPQPPAQNWNRRLSTWDDIRKAHRG
jgi:quercetin dioxygenase-like cupin family protein